MIKGVFPSPSRGVFKNFSGPCFRSNRAREGKSPLRKSSSRVGLWKRKEAKKPFSFWQFRICDMDLLAHKLLKLSAGVAPIAAAAGSGGGLGVWAQWDGYQ